MPLFQAANAGLISLQFWTGVALEPQIAYTSSSWIAPAPSGLTTFHHPANRLPLIDLPPVFPQSGVVATGIAWPPRLSQGQAIVPLQSASDPSLEAIYPHSSLFSTTVTIGDSPHQLVVDTGASNSVFDQRLAQQMGWQSQAVPGDMRSLVAGKFCPQLSLKLYQLPILSVGGASVEGMAGLGLPFSTNPVETAGVLGMDFLSEFDLVLDPPNRQLQLRPPSTPNPDAIPLVGRSGLMITEVKMGELESVPLMLDTGASLTFISPDLAERLKLDLSQAEPIEVVGFCGTEPGLYLQLDHLGLGRHSVRNLDIMILNSPVLNALGVEGILGQNFLSRYRQHWQFGAPNASGFPTTGSLELQTENGEG